ncbi:unnamed protein product [Rhizophagus irregularis]|nr:unnamed protein product [Rhizophagus irregularis]
MSSSSLEEFTTIFTNINSNYSNIISRPPSVLYRYHKTPIHVSSNIKSAYDFPLGIYNPTNPTAIQQIETDNYYIEDIRKDNKPSKGGLFGTLRRKKRNNRKNISIGANLSTVVKKPFSKINSCFRNFYTGLKTLDRSYRYLDHADPYFVIECGILRLMNGSGRLSQIGFLEIKIKKTFNSNDINDMNNTTYTTYEALKNLLNKHRVTYREVEHVLEGRSDQIAEIRGNRKEQAAKAMVIDVSFQQGHKYYLTVLPGSNKVNLELIRTFLKADKISFAKTQVMKRLTNCDLGAVPPFSFNKDLNVIIDPELYKNEEIVFNAGRLDRSIYIFLKDYRRILESEYQENPISIELSISQVETNFFEDSDPQQSMLEQDKLESKMVISNKNEQTK